MPGTNTQGQGLGQLTLLTVSPGEARAAGALAADVVTAGAVLTLAHTPTVLPVKRCRAAWRNGGDNCSGTVGTKPVICCLFLCTHGEEQ